MTKTNKTPAALTVTLTRLTDGIVDPFESFNACARATFTWSDDCDDCSVAAYGVSDDELDAMIAAKAHEGADFDGWKVEVA